MMARGWFTSPILVASIVLAGCSLFGSGQSATHRWGGMVSDLRVQWGAEPGIDLLTGTAVPVRAYLESRELAQYTGNLDDAYPGFTRAVPPDEPPVPSNPAAWARRPDLDRPSTSPLVGNIRFHIRSVERSGRNVTVTVCSYRYGVAERQADGAFAARVAGGPLETRGIFGIQLLLVAPADESKSALPPQTGPEPAPSVDVFGDWQVTGFLTSSAGSSKTQWPNYATDQATCVEKAPDAPERRAFLVNGEHPRSEFPTSPPSPGWPESTS
jgi:hypothetical protein